MVFNWLSGKRVPVKYVTRNNLEDEVNKFFKTPKFDTSLVYFLNLDTTSISKLIDRDNVVVIDHHPDHIAQKDLYTKCKTIFKEYSSCSKLLYNLLHKKFPGEVTTRQKHLILLVDDYESYTFQLDQSYDLGVVYNNMQGEKPVRFYSKFNNGFSGFDSNDQTTISYYKSRVDKIKTELQPFAAQIPIDNIKYDFVSTFANGYVNEISDYLLEKYTSDVCLIINLETKRVTFRRNKNCKLNLKSIATKLCNGWGYEYAAGGYVTDKLLDFSKLFTPVE